MAKCNSELQKYKRAKEKVLLDRLGAKKGTLIISKALTDGSKERQETVRRFL